MPDELTHKEKGEQMLSWARKSKFPKEVQLNPWTKITDTQAYVNTQIETMGAYPAATIMWVKAYLRLYQLKELLINKKSKK